ncbi:hypothetical protein [Corynebacterium sp. A21]|uniref:hypothetical protein n=1 Tax=Corynebacterium sp. A21 TaxID=3457318 RepID=UPI003FD64331
MRISEAGNAPVYNLTVDDNHEYLANGIPVHNCDALRYAVFSTRHTWSRYLRN